MCLEVVNVCVDEKYLDEKKQGRYGGEGFLFNNNKTRNPGDVYGKINY